MTPQPDLLETIAKALLEELRAPDSYQLTLITDTMIQLNQRPRIPYYFYIVPDADHITIITWARKDQTVPYENPKLIEIIQETIDQHPTHLETHELITNNQLPKP